MNSKIRYILIKPVVIPFCFFAGLMMLSVMASAQEEPPKPIVVTVSTFQHLSFGTFIQAGNYGTLTVTPEGGRTCDGSIIIPTMFSIVTPALFDIEALPGTLITINKGPDSQLTSSNGGSLTLKVGEPSTGNPFIVRTVHTEVFIGGTLVVGPLSANPAGDYGGTFQITFIQQ